MSLNGEVSLSVPIPSSLLVVDSLKVDMAAVAPELS